MFPVMAGLSTVNLEILTKASLTAGGVCKPRGISSEEEETVFVDGDIASDFIAAASISVEDAIEALGKAARRNDSSVEEVISQAVRRVARSMFGLRPIAQVHIMRVGEEDLGA